MPTTTSTSLSPRMRDLVRAVESLTASRGIPPSITEVAAALHVHPSRAQQLAVKAEARGAIVREARIPRSLRVARGTSDRPSTRRTAK